MNNKKNIIILALMIVFAVIISIGTACYFNGITFCIIYELGYGIILSVLVPILYVKSNEKLSLNSFGIKKLRNVDYIIIAVIIMVSLSSQVFSSDMSKVDINLFPLSILPLLMTTFFEEFLFRGFLQNRIEKSYGCFSAIILSGFIFAIYHLGYPGFRDLYDIVVLFFVGIVFAISFKLCNNNVIASYFINLPNAYLTYLLKVEQFPKFSLNFTWACAIGCIITIYIFIRTFKKAA